VFSSLSLLRRSPAADIRPAPAGPPGGGGRGSRDVLPPPTSPGILGRFATRNLLPLLLTAHPPPSRWRAFLLLALPGAGLPTGAARAQAPFTASPEWWGKPALGRELVSALWKDEAPAGPTPSGRSARFRMFGMVPGFINEPVGLDSDDP